MWGSYNEQLGRIFSFPNIEGFFTEDDYLALRTLIFCSSRLIGDGQGNEFHDNLQYTRGQIELICDFIGLPMYMKGDVLKEIAALAKGRNS